MDIQKIKEDYPAGTTIELIRMDGESHMYEGLKGEVTGVDDIGQIHMKWENGSSLALNPEIDAFSKVEPADKIKVLLVRPRKYPRLVEIENSLESMQKIVGGMIEEYMPFEDEVAIIRNEDGRARELPFNRAIYDDNGKVVDVIVGDFFIVSAPLDSDKFKSLPQDLAEKYQEKFQYPEHFYITEDSIEPIPYTPAHKEMER